VTSLEERWLRGAAFFVTVSEHDVRVVDIPDPRAARGLFEGACAGRTFSASATSLLKIVSENRWQASPDEASPHRALSIFKSKRTSCAGGHSSMWETHPGAVEKLSQTAKQLEKELEAQKSVKGTEPS